MFPVIHQKKVHFFHYSGKWNQGQMDW
jgi:hypothetical protein